MTNPTPHPTAPTDREVEAMRAMLRWCAQSAETRTVAAYLARLDAAHDGSREDNTITVTTKRFDCWTRNDLGRDRVAVCFDSDAGRATSLVLSGEALASLYVELRRFLGELGGHGPSRNEAKRAVASLDAARDEQPRCRETTPCEQPAMCVEHECQPGDELASTRSEATAAGDDKLAGLKRKIQQQRATLRDRDRKIAVAKQHCGRVREIIACEDARWAVREGHPCPEAAWAWQFMRAIRDLIGMRHHEPGAKVPAVVLDRLRALLKREAAPTVEVRGTVEDAAKGGEA